MAEVANSAAGEGPATARPQKYGRPGSRALSIFTYTLNASILRAHALGPLRLGELEGRIGLAPQTSIRAGVSNLCGLGVLAKIENVAGSRASFTGLTSAGHDLLEVADRIERWLEHAPSGPIPLEGVGAVGAIKALIAGWDSAIVRALAERPLALTELNTLIEDVSYPTLERRLNRLRSASLIEPVKGPGRPRRYAVSEWLGHAMAPLSIAGRWERQHMPDEVRPISDVEVEATFLLTLPLIELPSALSGSCALAVLTASRLDEGPRSVAGVTLGPEEGRLASTVPCNGTSPTTWALGTPDAWLDAVIDGRSDRLRIRGVDRELSLHIVRQLHDLLFPPLTSADLRV